MKLLFFLLIFIVLFGCLQSPPVPTGAAGDNLGAQTPSTHPTKMKLGPQIWLIKDGNGNEVGEKINLNAYDAAKNAWLDCDILTCTLANAYNPNAGAKPYAQEDFAGEVINTTGGSCTFSRSYFIDWNMTRILIPIYTMVNRTCSSPNGTIGTCGQDRILLFNDFTYENRTFENENLSQIDRMPGHWTTIYSVFDKSKPWVSCDISTKSYGVSFTDSQAWWNNSCGSKFQLTSYYNQSVATAQPNMIACASVNTSDGTKYNLSTGLNIRVLNATEDGFRPVIIMSNNSIFLGNSTNNATYCYVTNMGALLNNTTDYLYLCPVTTPPRLDTVSSISGGFCNLLNLSNFWTYGTGTGATTVDICSGNTGTLSGAVAYNSSGKHGFGLYGHPANTNEGMTFTSIAVGGTYTLEAWVMKVGSDNYRTLWSGSKYNVLVWGASPLGHLGTANGFSDSGFDETTLANGTLHHLVLSCNAGTGQFYVDGAAVGSTVTCRQEAITNYMTQGGGQTWDALTSDTMAFNNTSKSADNVKASSSIRVAVGPIQNLATNYINLNVAVVPNPPTLLSDLNCTVVANMSFLAANGSVNWFINGVNQTAQAANFTGLQNNTNTTVGTLSHTLILPGENISCSVYAQNNTTNSGWVSSVNDTEPETAPTIAALNLTPTTAYANSTLLCNVTVQDAESSSINISGNWSKNGVVQSSLNFTLNVTNNTNTNVANLTSGNLTAGDNWSCQVRAFDGSLNSSLNSSSNVTILSWYGSTNCSVITIIDGGVNYTLITATANCSLNATTTLNNARVFAVAGGGGGDIEGGAGGGGGGGINDTASLTLSGFYSIVVGLGGTANSTAATNGQDSSFGSLVVAKGGGKGGAGNGANGGSGGGSSASGGLTLVGGNGTAGQGYAGGGNLGFISSPYPSGGGGGANGTGKNASSSSISGDGGAGINSTISGTLKCYGAGGGGSNSVNSGTHGVGGCPANADGMANAIGGNISGAPNTGDGGAGHYTGGIGGAGGTGIVIVKFTASGANAAPNISSINLTPALAYLNSKLICNLTALDDISTSINISGNWFKNGVNQTTLSFTINATNATNTNVANLTSGNLSIGDNWSCAAKASDGTLSSDTNYSANVTILNTIPIITYINLTPTIAYVNSTLICNTTVQDNESSSINISYNWFNNGANQTALAGSVNVTNNTNTNIANLTSGNLTLGANWSCAVRAYDGNDYSSLNYSSNVTITDFPTAISLGSGIFTLDFRPIHPYAANVMPVNQTSGISVFLFQNPSTSNTSINMSISPVISGFTFKVSCFYNPASAITLNTSYQFICNSTAGTNSSVWAWASFYKPLPTTQIYNISTQGIDP